MELVSPRSQIALDDGGTIRIANPEDVFEVVVERTVDSLIIRDLSDGRIYSVHPDDFVDAEKDSITMVGSITNGVALIDSNGATLMQWSAEQLGNPAEYQRMLNITSLALFMTAADFKAKWGLK